MQATASAHNGSEEEKLKISDNRNRCTVSATMALGFLVAAVLVAALSLISAFALDARTQPFFLRFSDTPFVQIGREIVTPLGKGDLLIPLLIILAGVGWWKKNPRHLQAGWLGLVAFAVSGIMALVLKAAIYRPRPFIPEDKTHISGYFQSFPSGDAAAAAAVAAVLYCFYPRLGWLWAFLAAIVCVFRVLRLAHWPSDALAGSAIGLLAAAAVFALEALRRQRRMKKASGTKVQKKPMNPPSHPEGATTGE